MLNSDNIHNITPSLGIASDHAGFELKQYIINNLVTKYNINYYIINYGCNNNNSCDYNDYAQLLCQDFTKNIIQAGILICGTGIGMSIFANKYHPNIRASLCHNTQLAQLTKEHNHSNILCLGALNNSPDNSLDIVYTWLTSVYSQEERHVRRVLKLNIS